MWCDHCTCGHGIGDDHQSLKAGGDRRGDEIPCRMIVCFEKCEDVDLIHKNNECVK